LIARLKTDRKQQPSVFTEGSDAPKEADDKDYAAGKDEKFDGVKDGVAQC